MVSSLQNVRGGIGLGKAEARTPSPVWTKKIPEFFWRSHKTETASTVRDYQTEFTRLLNRVGKLSMEQQVGCFVSGLKDSI